MPKTKQKKTPTKIGKKVENLSKLLQMLKKGKVPKPRKITRSDKK